MPIYTYKCRKCPNRDTVMRSLKDANAPLRCVACGASMDKTMSQSSFQLKGSGWYKDGYK